MKKLSILFLSLLLTCATLVTTASAATPYVSSSTVYHGAEPDECIPQHYSANESATSSATHLDAAQTPQRPAPSSKACAYEPELFRLYH